MKLQHFLFISTLIALCSCSHTSSTRGPISIVQLKSRDLVTIRPRLVSLLGTDSSGLDALSMITTYEEYLFSLVPPDTSFRGTPEPPLPSSSTNLNYIEGRDNYAYPPRKNILNENFTSSLLPQIMRQHLRQWIEQLNDFYLSYNQTLDMNVAKKGAAAGYNALLSGPTLSDIPKISDKMKTLLETSEKLG